LLHDGDKLFVSSRGQGSSKAPGGLSDRNTPKSKYCLEDQTGLSLDRTTQLKLAAAVGGCRNEEIWLREDWPNLAKCHLRVNKKMEKNGNGPKMRKCKWKQNWKGARDHRNIQSDTH